MKTIIYNSPNRYYFLLTYWHTVDSMCRECQRSRAWAYRMLARYDRHQAYLIDGHTGRRELAIPRQLVVQYVTTTRRGNPQWRRKG